MSQSSNASNSAIERLLIETERYVYDPLGFVRFAFPWGHDQLSAHEGPDDWQADILSTLGEELRLRALKERQGPVQIAVGSGHGIGKSALMAWITIWAAATRPHPQGVVTANTKEQLSSKTWRELAKWHKLSIYHPFFKWTATKYGLRAEWETWFFSAIPWSKERSEAFAGTHEEHVFLLFDESSAIDDSIWETAEGAMTTPGAVWCCFGNRTRSTGRFSQCFKKFRHRWITREIDSRTAKMADTAKIDQWIEDYGEDSDFVRVRVRGMEPRSGSMQLIPSDLIEEAMQRSYHPSVYANAPRVMGVDVARYGDDQSVIIKRQGVVAHDIKRFRGLDTQTLASLVAQEINEYEPQVCFVDVVGIGAGVVDRLRRLGHKNIIEANGGVKLAMQDPERCVNVRTRNYIRLLEWMKSGGAIPYDSELRDELEAIEYGFDAVERWQLEKKEDMKDRVGSPDTADALAMTFVEFVATPADQASLYRGDGGRVAIAEYDVFADQGAREAAVNEYELFGR